ncbi:MAG: helix-turn-helix domain-containing protein [Candidatus Omnitrophota bacterium]
MLALTSIEFDGIVLAGKEAESIMDYYSMNDQGILKELGNRIRNNRLSSNISQKKLASQAGVSITVIQNIEYGKTATITGFLRVMRALRLLGQLDLFLPVARFSPLEIVKLEGKRRKRASKGVSSEGL